MVGDRACWRPLRCKRPSSTNGSTPTGWFTTPIRPRRAPKRLSPRRPEPRRHRARAQRNRRPSRRRRRSRAGGLNYIDFSITSPAPEQTFFGDDVMAVHLNLSPSLRPNQAITWHLNGKQLDFPPNAVSFALPRLDRGTYALAATITDQQTSESADQQQRDLFCAPALGAVAAVAAEKVAPSSSRPDAQLVR